MDAIPIIAFDLLKDFFWFHSGGALLQDTSFLCSNAIDILLCSQSPYPFHCCTSSTNYVEITQIVEFHVKYFICKTFAFVSS